jgi:hypothetical protein
VIRKVHGDVGLAQEVEECLLFLLVVQLSAKSRTVKKSNLVLYESAYDLVQIGWPSDFVYDKKIERLHV